MEFNGLTGVDFDYFKNKDKLSKEEYERIRNDLKMHFRALCYQMQKNHHSKTGGVLELQRDFHSFNKKSTDIYSEYKGSSNDFRVIIKLDKDALSIESVFSSYSKDEAYKIIDILTNKKMKLWEFVLSNKFMHMHIEFSKKNRKSNELKLNSLEINNKNYDNFILFIENNIKEDNYIFDLKIGYSFPKNECIRQGKNLVNLSYNSLINIKEMIEKIS